MAFLRYCWELGNNNSYPGCMTLPDSDNRTITRISDDGQKILVSGSNPYYGQTGNVNYSTDGGATWTTLYPTGVVEKKVWNTAAMSADGTKMIISYGNSYGGGRTYYSANSGLNWTQLMPDGDRTYNYCYVAVSDDGTRIVFGEYGKRLWYSSNSGSSWSELTPTGASDRAWNGVLISGNGTQIVAWIYDGRVWKSSDSGGSWTEIQPAGNSDKYWGYGDMSRDGTKIILVVLGGRVYYSQNSGSDWTEVYPEGEAVNRQWSAADVSNDGQYLIAGSNTDGGGYIYYSMDAGVTWHPINARGYFAIRNWTQSCRLAKNSRTTILGDATQCLQKLKYETGPAIFYVNTESTDGGTGISNDTTGSDRAFSSLYQFLFYARFLYACENVTVLCCGASTDSGSGAYTISDAVYTEPSYELTISGNTGVISGGQNGRYDPTKYRVSNIVFNVHTTPKQRIIVEDLQVLSGSIGIRFYSGTKDGSVVRKCIFVDCDCGMQIDSSGSYLKIENCAFRCTTYGIYIVSGQTARVYNCTNYTPNAEIYNSGTLIAKNCAGLHSSNNFYGGTQTVDHCATTSGVGTNPITISKWGLEFNWARYYKLVDYRINPTSLLVDAGIGPDIDPDVPTEDIIGNPRSGNTASVGAFEEPTTVTKLNFYVNTESTSGGTGITNDTTGGDRAFQDMRALFEALQLYGGIQSGVDIDVHFCGTVADGRRADLPASYEYFASNSVTLTLKGNRNVSSGFHGGRWNTSVYRKTLTDNNIVAMLNTTNSAWKGRLVVDGLQFDMGSNYMGFDVEGYWTNGSEVKNCIFRSTGSGGAQCLLRIAVQSGNFFVRNNIIQNFGSPGSMTCLELYNASAGAHLVYNNVVVGGWRGINFNSNPSTVKNCSVFNNSDDFSGTGTIDHCASDDGDGTNPITISNWDDQFYDPNYIANSDFSLKETSILLNAGIGTGLDNDVPTRDILNILRRSLTTATVGPFEYYYGWKLYLTRLDGRFINFDESSGIEIDNNHAIKVQVSSGILCDLDGLYLDKSTINEMKIVNYTITASDMTSKSFKITSPAANTDMMSLSIQGGLTQNFGIDYTCIDSTTVGWNGLGLDGFIIEGDKVQIEYPV